MHAVWVFNEFERFVIEPLPGTKITTGNRGPFAIVAVDMGTYWHGHIEAERGTPACREYRWRKSKFRLVSRGEP